MPIVIHDRFLKTVVYSLTPTLLVICWGLPGVGKITSGGVPHWFGEQFGKTFLASFPGLAVSFYSIAVLEVLAAVAALASLLRGEFIRDVHPNFLFIAITLSLVLFVQLFFGKQLLNDFGGTRDLFMYFAGTLVMLIAVRSFPARSSGTNTAGH